MTIYQINSSREGSLRRRSSRRSSKQSEEKAPAEQFVTKLIETEHSQVGGVSLGVYMRYFKSIGVPFAIIIFIFNALNQTMQVLSNCEKIFVNTF